MSTSGNPVDGDKNNEDDQNLDVNKPGEGDKPGKADKHGSGTVKSSNKDKLRRHKFSCRTKDCKKPDDDDMVRCDSCRKWHHYLCGGVDHTVAERDWNCKECENKSSKHSVFSKRRMDAEMKILEEQQRLKYIRKEEQRKLKERLLEEENERIRLEKEKINEEYMTQREKNDEEFVNSKIELLSGASSRSSITTESSRKRTEQWVERQTTTNARNIQFKSTVEEQRPQTTDQRYIRS